jgi:DNA-binding transcriptional LysR family regulator
MLNAAQLARLDLNLLVLFSVVLEEGHVARAAGRLNLTPSAVSHGLGRLRRLLNDPLFLRTPRGVVPTDRARGLAEPVAEIMARVGSVIATAAPFDPATSRRRFMIGAPDGASAVVLALLMARLGKQAPGIDIGLAHLMPEQSVRTVAQAWRQGLEMLEARTVDIAVLPLGRCRRASSHAGSTKRISSWRCARAMRSRATRASPRSAGWAICSCRSAAILVGSSTSS